MKLLQIMASSNRQRKRKKCHKCGEELSHSAFVHHQNPIVCPEKNPPSISSGESTFELGDISDQISIPENSAINQDSVKLILKHVYSLLFSSYAIAFQNVASLCC